MENKTKDLLAIINAKTKRKEMKRQKHKIEDPKRTYAIIKRKRKWTIFFVELFAQSNIFRESTHINNNENINILYDFSKPLWCKATGWMKKWDLKEGKGSTAVRARCTRQPVRSANRNARFRSSQMARGPCIAGNASRSTSRSGTGFRGYSSSSDYQLLISF